MFKLTIFQPVALAIACVIFSEAPCTFAMNDNELASSTTRNEPAHPRGNNGDSSPFLQGIVKPARNAVLRFSRAGIVSKVHVKEGDFVRASQALLETEHELETSSVRMAELDANSDSSVSKAKLEFELAKTRYDRILEAMKRGASYEMERIEKKHALDAARLNLEEQTETKRRFQIKLEIARNELESKILKAPFDGQILRLHHTLGNSVDFSTPAVVCADLSTLKVEMNLPASMYGQFRVGDIRKLAAASPISRHLDGKIKHVASEIEPSSQTFRVTFEIANADLALPSGFEVWYVSDGRKPSFVQSARSN